MAGKLGEVSFLLEYIHTECYVPFYYAAALLVWLL